MHDLRTERTVRLVCAVERARLLECGHVQLREALEVGGRGSGAVLGAREQVRAQDVAVVPADRRGRREGDGLEDGAHVREEAARAAREEAAPAGAPLVLGSADEAAERRR
jgi:hypothetical protein